MVDAEKPPPPGVERRTRNTFEHIIANHGDCWILARELIEINEGEDPVVATYDDHEFKVTKRVLTEKSKFFDGMFKSHFANFKDATNPTLMEVDINALEIVFMVLHNSKTQDGLDKIDIKGLWLMIAICDQYHINHKRMKPWFEKWYHENSEMLFSCARHLFLSEDSEDEDCVASSLLFPSYAFDHPTAFLRVTKHLVYTSKGRISEKNPTDKRHLSTPIRIVQQLNGARGRVRTLLEKEVFEPVTDLIDDARCQCRQQTTYEFLEELRRLKLFPSLELMAAKTPLTVIIDKLGDFSYQPRHLNASCLRCNRNYSKLVKAAGKKYDHHFDGLCLDCIAKPRTSEKPPRFSKRTRPFYDDDYSVEEIVWDDGCRVKHDEPTWYFSFCAREEKRRFGP